MSKWPTSKLGAVLRLDLDRVPIDVAASYPMVGVLSFGKGLFDREPIENGKTSYRVFYRLKADHVVMSQLFGWEGALALSSEKFAGKFLSPQFPTFHCDSSKLEREFLGWLMRRPAFWEDLGSRASGMGDRRRTLNPEALFACEIPLPPLDEQRRIVSRIEEFAAKVEEARRCRQSFEEADRLWERSLAEALDRLAAKHPVSKFREVCEVVRGGSPRPAGSPVYYGGNIPFLKVGDLTKDESKYVTQYTFTIKEAGLRKTRRVEANTLLLTNSGATLGVPKIVTFATCFNDGIQAFLNLREDISKEYLYYFLRSKTVFFREWVARGQGQPNLNTEMVKTMSFPRPPLSEQLAISKHFDDLRAKVDALKKLQSETGAELDALMPSILDKAFRGEL
jgi:type I restriction enzyme, S subunit